MRTQDNETKFNISEEVNWSAMSLPGHLKPRFMGSSFVAPDKQIPELLEESQGFYKCQDFKFSKLSSYFRELNLGPIIQHNRKVFQLLTTTL